MFICVYRNLFLWTTATRIYILFFKFFFFLIYNFVCINFFIFIYQLLLFVKIYLFYFSVFLFFLWLFYNPDELKISSNSFKNLSDLDIKLLEKWSRWKYRGIKKEVYLFVDFIYDVKFFYKNLNHYKLLSTILVVFFIKIIFFTFFYIIFFFFLRLYFYFYKFLSSFFFKERYVISFNVTTPETCEFFFF